MRKIRLWLKILIIFIVFILLLLLPVLIRLFKSDGFLAGKERIDGTGHRYYTDGKYVYYQHTVLIGGFDVDGYYPLVKRVKDADLATFNPSQPSYNIENGRVTYDEGLRFDYAKDKNSVFYRYYKIEGADVATFEHFDNTSSTPFYGKDKDSVFYKQFELEGADPNTFQILGCRYAKDDNHVFYEENILENADPQTFKAPC